MTYPEMPPAPTLRTPERGLELLTWQSQNPRAEGIRGKCRNTRPPVPRVSRIPRFNNRPHFGFNLSGTPRKQETTRSARSAGRRSLGSFKVALLCLVAVVAQSLAG